jgi:hypothetical protein
MDLLHTDDLEGSVKQLDDAFLAATTASEAAEEHFLDLLDEALVTLYTYKKRVVCTGLEWMFQSLDTHDNFAERFRTLFPEVTDAFLEASGVNTRILDVTCSALLQLVPENERLGFCRTLILRQGPHCKQWTSNLSRHGINNEDIAELLFDILEDEETPAEACDQLISVITANKRTDKVDLHPEFRLLGAQEFQIAAELCAEHNPAKVLATLQGKFWDGHDQTQGFTWQLNHLLGTDALDEIIAVAVEACKDTESKVDYIAQLYKRTVRNRGIDVLIREALERDNKTYFDSHMAQCLANSQDRLILLYQTELYKLIHEYATSLAWYIDERLRDAMANMGWRVAHVSISMHQHRPSRYVELDEQRYIQPFSDRFFPKRGEEVLFNPSTGKQLGARTHAASFLKIER